MLIRLVRFSIKDTEALAKHLFSFPQTGLESFTGKLHQNVKVSIIPVLQKLFQRREMVKSSEARLFLVLNKTRTV